MTGSVGRSLINANASSGEVEDFRTFWIVWKVFPNLRPSSASTE